MSMHTTTRPSLASPLALFVAGGACDHVGEAWPSRCTNCDGQRPVTFAPVTARGDCSIHPNYPAPCDRCKRDSLTTT